MSSPVVVRNSDTADGRVDVQLNQKNLLYGRYSYNRTPVQFPGLLPTVNQAGLNIAPGGAIFNFYGNAQDNARTRRSTTSTPSAPTFCSLSASDIPASITSHSR